MTTSKSAFSVSVNVRKFPRPVCRCADCVSWARLSLEEQRDACETKDWSFIRVVSLLVDLQIVGVDDFKADISWMQVWPTGAIHTSSLLLPTPLKGLRVSCLQAGKLYSGSGVDKSLPIDVKAALQSFGKHMSTHSISGIDHPAHCDLSGVRRVQHG